MRIVHLILTRHFAGSERHAVELANAQAATHDVTLVLRRSATQARVDATAHRVDPRVRIEVVPDWLSSWHARRLVKRLRPDVAHAHLSGGCRALRGLRDVCLRVATLHIRYKPQQHARLDGLIAIAPWQLEAIPAQLRTHSTQIDNWTLPQQTTDDARERVRTLHGIAPSTLVIGALGRAVPNKGFDVLIEAFRRAQLPNAKLVIVGQGSALAELRKSAGPDVLLPGFADRPHDWLAAFDCFVSAARDEPFGLVLLEAMSAGLPILASATLGAQHLAQVIGRPLLPIGDVDALTDALRTFAAAPPPRQSYPMQRFGIESKLDEIEAFYRRELAAR